jgi:hypothetical protein
VIAQPRAGSSTATTNTVTLRHRPAPFAARASNALLYLRSHYCIL